METEAARKVREGTEVHEGGGFTLSNEAAIEHMRVLSAISAIAFKINTGVSMVRGSLTTFCAAQYGTKGKTHKKVLREMVDYYEKTYGREITQDSVVRALSK